jgi:ligand-binding sensor domain-containing protein
VALHGDQLFAGGPGGVTVWNTADGSVVRRITTGDGLPSPAVNALWVDDDGTLWVATEGGLARLTSDRVILYTAADGLDSNNVTALARVRGTLVIGTAYSGRTGGGLLRLRESGWEPVGGFPSADPNQSPGRLSYNVSLIREDPLTASGLWVGTTNGLGYFDGEKWMRFSKTDGLPDNFVSALYFDKNNTLWVGTAAGAVRFDGKQFQSFRQLREMLGSWVVGITQDDAGRYWFSGASGIVSYDPSVADWQKFDSQNGNLPTYTMLVAARAADGALYFGSEGGGLVRYDGGFKTWTLPNIPVSMSFGRVLPAPDGSVLFVREYGVQVDRFDPATRTWSTPEGLPCDYCAPLAFDAQSRMWAASDRGLWIITGQESVHLTKDQGLPGNNVISVALAPDGSAWIGTDGGLAQWDGQTVKQVFNADNSGFSGSFIRKVLAASDGSVWVSTETNLSHLKADGTWEHFRPRAPFSFDVRVNDLAEAGDGAIWAATAGDGVYRFADEAWTRFRSDAPGVILPNGDVNSVTAAPDGSVWVSLAFNGVARFDGQEWSLFNVKEGLIHSNVLDIYVDNAGTAWFATSGGVTRWGP